EAMVEWLCYEVLPEGNGRTNNLNDALWKTRPLSSHSTYLEWAQFRFGSPLAAYLHRHIAGEFGYNLGFQSDKVATVLWNSSLPVVDPGTLLPDGKLFRDRGIYFYRSGWKSGATGNEILFSFYSGKFYGGHAQEDQNQFTLYAYGDRFALDCGAVGAADGPKQSETHNLVLIDGAGQHNAGNSIGTDGRITASLLSPFADYVRGDAEPAYDTYSPFNAPGVPFPGSDWSWGYDGGNPVERADRLVAVVKGPAAPPYVLIADDVAKDSLSHTYDWLLHTDQGNTIEMSSNPVVVQGGRSFLDLYFANPQPPALSFSAAPYVHGGEDPETLRFVAQTQAAAPRFFVALVPRDSSLVPPLYQATPAGSATKLLLDWGAVQDHALFNPERTFLADVLATDGVLAVVRLEGPSTSRWLLAEGNSLSYNKTPLLMLFGGTGSGALSNGVVHLSRDDLAFLAYAPGVQQVEGPQGPISFVVSGDYVMSPPTAVGRAQPPGPVAALWPAAPNPFNPGTLIRFELREPGFVSLRIYDVGGRVVQTLVEEPLSGGPFRVHWDGTDALGHPQASGVYFVELRAGSERHARKIILAR
ncbi:MAG: FlgD immunoglobulin-like domain containing protein, partial [Candidatus Krumholzibacteriia bacterium]